MTIKLWVVFPIVLFLFLLSLMWIWHRDLRRDTNKIKADMLTETTIGATFNMVSNKLQSMNLELKVSHNTGFLKQENGSQETIGVSSIRAHLGDYWGFPFLRTSVTAFWGFDEGGKLIDIWIWKTTDSL